MKILMSIKPQYVAAIEALKKTVEFRKVIPYGLAKGDIIVVYSSSPTQKIVGEIEVGDVHQFTTDTLWEYYGDKGAISKEDFFKYFDKAIEGYAIDIEWYHKYLRPYTLEEMFPDIKKPPQNFCYIDKDFHIFKNALILDDIMYEPILTESYDERNGCAPQWTRCDLCDLRLMGAKGTIRNKKCELQICMKFFTVEKLREGKGMYMKKMATIKDWQINPCNKTDDNNKVEMPLIERAKLSLIGKCLYEDGEDVGEITDVIKADAHNYVILYKFGLKEFHSPFNEYDLDDLVTDGELCQYFDQYDDDGNVVDTTEMHYEIKDLWLKTE